MIDTSTFEKAVRDYLNGLRDWDSIHQLALQMEVDRFEFPTELRKPLEELHSAFLTADSKDDPQFRADRNEISQSLAEIERLRKNAEVLGSAVVAEGQNTLEREQEENRRRKYLEKRARRHKR